MLRLTVWLSALASTQYNYAISLSINAFSTRRKMSLRGRVKRIRMIPTRPSLEGGKRIAGMIVVLVTKAACGENGNFNMEREGVRDEKIFCFGDGNHGVRRGRTRATGGGNVARWSGMHLSPI